MRAALNAITDELKRLKASGVKSVVVSEQSLATLREAVRTRQKTTPLEKNVAQVAGTPALGQVGPAAKDQVQSDEGPPSKFTVKPLAPAATPSFPPPPVGSL